MELSDAREGLFVVFGFDEAQVVDLEAQFVGVVHLEAFVLFEVGQFDSYGYLFNQPFFISLDSSAVPNVMPHPNVYEV